MKYRDLADMDEDERILGIGNEVTLGRKTVAFIMDSEPGKADRYIDKLQKRFPGVRILWRGDGPVPNTVAVKVGPPEN